MVTIVTICLSTLVAQVLPEAPVAVAATTQPTLTELRAEHKKLVDEEFSALTERKPLAMEKILSVVIEDGHLHVRPLIAPTGGAVSQPATDWAGKMSVTVGLPETLMMHLKHIDLSQPDQLAVYTHIITGADYLQISRDAESEHVISTITLIQSRMFADENDDPVRLTVKIVDDRQADPLVNLVLSGASFAQLRRDHPQTMRKYLLPILSDIRAAGVMRTSDAATAWQVLSNEVTIDPKLRLRVDGLIGRLGNSDFADRTAAGEELAGMGAIAGVVIGRMDLSRLSPDARATADAIVRAHAPLPEKRVAELRKDMTFLCDSLYLDDPILRKAALARIGDLTGKSIDLPDTLTPEERTARIDALARQLTPSPTTQPQE
jgi:hypothetical protein